jgi:outer membrane protein
MLFRKTLYAFLMVAASFSARAQRADSTATVYDMRKCLSIAIKNNLTVQQDSVSAQRARIALLQQKENMIPSLSGNIGRYITTGRTVNPVTNTYVNESVTYDNYSVGGNVTIFNGLAYQNAIKQASLAFQSGKMNFQAAKDIVTVNVITNYLQALDALQQMDAAKSALAVAKEQDDRGELLEKEGNNTTASTIYDLRGSLQQANVSYVTAQNNVSSAMLSLFQVMNIPYDKYATLAPLNAADLQGDKDADPEMVYQTALSGLAQIKAATLLRQSAEKEVKYYRGMLYPSLVGGYGLSTNYSNSNPASYSDQFHNNYGTQVSLGLTIPIFTNGVKRNALSNAKLDLLNDKYLEDNTKIMVRQNIEQAYYNMISAYKRYQALDDEVKAYTESFRISKLRFESGVLNSVDYITSKNNMDSATISFIAAQYDYLVYSKVLDYYQGKLSF